MSYLQKTNRWKSSLLPTLSKKKKKDFSQNSLKTIPIQWWRWVVTIRWYEYWKVSKKTDFHSYKKMQMITTLSKCKSYWIVSYRICSIIQKESLLMLSKPIFRDGGAKFLHNRSNKYFNSVHLTHWNTKKVFKHQSIFSKSAKQSTRIQPRGLDDEWRGSDHLLWRNKSNDNWGIVHSTTAPECSKKVKLAATSFKLFFFESIFYNIKWKAHGTWIHLYW